MLLKGDAFATLDIATTLAGAGVIAIGLGAVAGAVARLGRTISSAAEGRSAPGEPSVRPTSAPAAPSGPAEAPAAPEPKRRAEPRLPPAPTLPADTPETAPEPKPAAPDVKLDVAAARPQRPPVVVARPRRAPKAEPSEARDEQAFEGPIVVAPKFSGFAVQRPEAPPAEVARPEVTPPPAEPSPGTQPSEVAAVEDVEAAPVEPPVVEAATEGVADSAPEASAGPEPSVAAREDDVSPPAKTPPPDWLVRARARREARAKSEPVVEAPTTPVPPAAEAEEPSRIVIREGELNGVTYRFFQDGSVEAQSAHGVRRFPTVEALRATVLGARGKDGAPPDPSRPDFAEAADIDGRTTPEDGPAEGERMDAPRFRAAGADEPASPDQSFDENEALDAAIAELEGGRDPAATGR
ncbi:hypothetical protein GCM10008179_16990 [Hansschlegelia plantiphila]|uniref:Uncharacterized protein n=2 Tax=Hansschlegelia plantiphila TaxID=374655 RepID=A0A9W6J1H8_9HYPH|nr:hypothetical protein GCM10008179_16990 [Hansschlegelia plantiphila]